MSTAARPRGRPGDLASQGVVFTDAHSPSAMCTPTRYSLLIPGGGYFYTGHPVMGSVDALVELFFLLAFLGGFALLAEGDVEAVSVLVMFGVLLGLEKLLTIYHSRHYVTEFLPASDVISVGLGTYFTCAELIIARESQM